MRRDSKGLFKWRAWQWFLAGFVTVSLTLMLTVAGCSTARVEKPLPAGYAKLELNDGKKWVVHKPMMAHIRKLEGAVHGFEKRGDVNHAALALEIQENLGRLATNCTMEGRAHDELHKWLMPFLATSTEYVNATERAEQEERLREIEGALVVFNRYFE